MEAVGTTPWLPRMLAAKSPCGAWKVLNDIYAPKTIMDKSRAAQEFNAIQMQEGEDPEEYFTKIDQVVQPLDMLDGSKDIDEANIHIVQFIGVVQRRK